MKVCACGVWAALGVETGWLEKAVIRAEMLVDKTGHMAGGAAWRPWGSSEVNENELEVEAPTSVPDVSPRPRAVSFLPPGSCRAALCPALRSLQGEGGAVRMWR